MLLLLQQLLGISVFPRTPTNITGAVVKAAAPSPTVGDSIGTWASPTLPEGLSGDISPDIISTMQKYEEVAVHDDFKALWNTLSQSVPIFDFSINHHQPIFFFFAGSYQP